MRRANRVWVFAREATRMRWQDGKLIAWHRHMILEAITSAPPLLAAGWSLLYLLFGGGFGGAVLIFFVLKMLGR